jgi:hypothetical protein
MRGAFVVLGESSTSMVLGTDFAPFIQGGRRMRPDVLRRIAARTKSKLRESEKKKPGMRGINRRKRATGPAGQVADGENGHRRGRSRVLRNCLAQIGPRVLARDKVHVS